jgi:hypothetical protein
VARIVLNRLIVSSTTSLQAYSQARASQRGDFAMQLYLSHPSSWGYLILGSGGQLSSCRGIVRSLAVLTCECSETCIMAMHVVSQDDLISIAQFDLHQNQNISSPQTDCNSLLSLCPCIKQVMGPSRLWLACARTRATEVCVSLALERQSAVSSVFAVNVRECTACVH